MTVRINKSGTARSVDVASVENAVGSDLPSRFKAFLGEYDGAEPDTNIFRINDVNDSGVNRFIPTHRILDERKSIDKLSVRAFPIAWAEGGNYVIIDLDAAGAVFFWDHETGELTRIANDFDGFLAMLQPFSCDEIELKPGQVKSVWVDPEFLKEFGNG